MEKTQQVVKNNICNNGRNSTLTDKMSKIWTTKRELICCVSKEKTIKITVFHLGTREVKPVIVVAADLKASSSSAAAVLAA